ncbi:MAG TPA: hypothetical protein VGD68_10630, partial [Streptosporangiaceae bacterium]
GPAAAAAQAIPAAPPARPAHTRPAGPTELPPPAFTRPDLPAPGATAELTDLAELPTQTELPAPAGIGETPKPATPPEASAPSAPPKPSAPPEASAPSAPPEVAIPSAPLVAGTPPAAGLPPAARVTPETPTRAEMPAPAEVEAAAGATAVDLPAPEPEPEPEPGPGRANLRSRAVPSIERALSGPGRTDSWQRKVRVVPGGQGPGQRDREGLDRDRARLPLSSPHRIVFLGCTSGAGQTVTALLTGQVLAALRQEAVAAIDLNPGPASLARLAPNPPALTVTALLAGSGPAPDHRQLGRARLDVVAVGAGPGSPAVGERDYPLLAEQASRRYRLTLVDPGAAEVTRILGIAGQLVLVAPASADAPRSLGMTLEWLSGHGHGELASRAVTVVNGVSRASAGDVEQAEAVARGRCRAIVRIPWDDSLASGAASASSLRPQARHAYTALAGVLIAGLAARPVPRRVVR